MGCLVIFIGLFVPRLILAVAWAVGMFGATFWGFIGWVFMPYTTLAATIAFTNGLGQSWTVIIVVIGVIIDIGTSQGILSEDS